MSVRKVWSDPIIGSKRALCSPPAILYLTQVSALRLEKRRTLFNHMKQLLKSGTRAFQGDQWVRKRFCKELAGRKKELRFTSAYKRLGRFAQVVWALPV